MRARQVEAALFDFSQLAPQSRAAPHGRDARDEAPEVIAPRFRMLRCQRKIPCADSALTPARLCLEQGPATNAPAAVRPPRGHARQTGRTARASAAGR